MALRELVTGTNDCAPQDSTSTANPLSQLANQLLGLDVKGKAHNREEIDQHATSGHQSSSSAVDRQISAASSSIFHSIKGKQPLSQDVAPTLNGLRTLHEIGQHEQQLRNQQAAVGSLHGVLRTFVASGSQQRAYNPQGSSPEVQLSVPHQCRIRDRATILARQMYAGQGEQFADIQVGRLLHSLAIQPEKLPSANHTNPLAFHHAWRPPPPLPLPLLQTGPTGVPHAAPSRQVPQGDTWVAEFHSRQAAGNTSQGATWADEFGAAAGQHPGQMLAGGSAWVQEFHPPGGRGTWVEEFKAGLGGSSAETWVGEFERADGAVAGIDRLMAGKGNAAAESGQLYNALASRGDAKMQRSNFLQFLAKMSQGELQLRGNTLVGRDGQTRNADGSVTETTEDATTGAGDWAAEFLGPGGSASSMSQQAWVSEFLGQDANNTAPARATPRASTDLAAAADVDWVGDYVAEIDGAAHAWAQQFLAQIENEGVGDPHDPELQQWLDEFAGEQDTTIPTQGADGEYVFAPNNPYLDEKDPFTIGEQLFKDGSLAAAALAFEAVLHREPYRTDVWRLLGTVHAENEDDRLAIKAMMQGLNAEPQDLNLLLALGVSYTNELDTNEAAGYLQRWLRCHPLTSATFTQMGPPPDSSQWLTHLEQVLQRVLASHPGNADVHTVLGVLQHLRYNYAEAAEQFARALELRPSDYSLWNKLGATYANAGNSERAISAYQRSLQLKPNYVRAWTNLGVSYANLGRYRDAARHYAKALSRNPGARGVWSYLRKAAVQLGDAALARTAEQQDAGNLRDWLGTVEDGMQGHAAVATTIA